MRQKRLLGSGDMNTSAMNCKSQLADLHCDFMTCLTLVLADGNPWPSSSGAYESKTTQGDTMPTKTSTSWHTPAENPLRCLLFYSSGLQMASRRPLLTTSASSSSPLLLLLFDHATHHHHHQHRDHHQHNCHRPGSHPPVIEWEEHATKIL